MATGSVIVLGKHTVRIRQHINASGTNYVHISMRKVLNFHISMRVVLTRSEHVLQWGCGENEIP